jgi:hypothetical protein
MAARPTSAGDADQDAPEWWRRSANFRRVPIIAMIVLVVVLFRATQSHGPPSIRTSCSKPSFVLSTTHTVQRKVVQWTATGPPGMRYQLTLGASGFVRVDGNLKATPDYGVTKDQMQAASQEMSMDGDCKQSGRFAPFRGSGTFNVRMFRFGGTTSLPTATNVDTVELKVDPRD